MRYYSGGAKTAWLISLWMMLPMFGFSEVIQRETVRIGALVPLTGGLAIMGKTAMTTMGVAEQNFEGLFQDVNIELVVEDTQTDPAIARQKIQALHEQGIQVIIGPFASSCVEAVKPYADEHQVLVISPTSTSLSLAQDDMIFRLIVNEAYKSDAITMFMQHEGISSVVLLYRDDTYGKDCVDAFKSRWTEQGGSIAGEIRYSPAQIDFTETVQELQTYVQSSVDSLGASQTGVFVIAYEEIGSIVKSAANSEVLSQVQWIENETANQIEAFVTDPDMTRFAVETGFTFATVDATALFHPVYPHIPKCENLLTLIYKTTEDILHKDILFTVYDSYQIASLVGMITDFGDKKELFIEFSKQLLGVSGVMNVDENGDRNFGVIAFSRFTQTETIPEWRLVATYRKPILGVYDSFSYYEYPSLKAEPTIQIGALLSLTGENANLGKGIQKTLNMANEDLRSYVTRHFGANASIEIVVADTASDPQTALQQIQNLHSQGITFFVGPLTSSELRAVEPYVSEKGLIVISPSSTSLDLASKDTIFRLALDNRKLAKGLAAYLQKEGIQYVQPLYRNDLYGSDFYSAFQSQFEEVGGICGEGISYDVNTHDFRATVSDLTDRITTTLETYGAQKMAALVIAYDEAVDLFNAIPENSILRTLSWIGGDGLSDNTLLFDDPGANRFAHDTDLIVFAPGNQSYDYIGLVEMAWRNVLQDYLGNRPSAYEFMAYDAAWYLTLLSIKGAYDQTGIDNQGDVLTQLVNSTQAAFQFYRFNEWGDSEYGYVDFYEYYDREPGMTYWTVFAKYSYQITGEELFYYDFISDSSAENWSVYE